MTSMEDIMHARTPWTILARTAILLGILFATTGSASAGIVGFNIQPANPDPIGSLSISADGSIVGTNINVPLVFGTAAGASHATTNEIDAYLDFDTGAKTGLAGNSTTYSSTGANFFILAGPLSSTLSGAGSPPVAMSVDMTTTVTSPTAGSNVFVLTAVLNSAYISPAIAADYGLTSSFNFTGTLSLSFVINSALAGNQVQSGSINLGPSAAGSAGANDANSGSVPAPPSVILAGLGVLCGAGGPFARRFRLRRKSS